MQKMSGLWKILLFFLLLSTVIEFAVFNCRALQSMAYREISYPAEKIEAENADVYEDGYYVLTGENGRGQFYLTDLDDVLQGAELKNIRVELELPQAFDRPDLESGVAKVQLYVRDEGHDRYAVLEEQVIRPDVEATGYLWLDTYGKVKTLVLDTALSEGDILRIKGIRLNSGKTFSVSPVRMLCVFVILVILYGLRGKSDLWNAENGISGRKELFYALLLGIFLLLPAFALNMTNDYVMADMHFRPYQQLAEALAEGRPYLLEEPSAALQALRNPYDHTAREAAGLVADADYLWDMAYYQGKYYVYFGVVPCLLLYLPWYILTGSHIQEVYVLLFLGTLLYAGIYLLCRSVLDQSARKIPYAFQLLASATVFWGSCITGCMAAPDAHDVPRVCGLVFVVWGLYLWKRSVCVDKGNGPKILLLVLGSLFMALAVGCRPNQLLYSFAAFPIFLPFLKTDGTYGKRQRNTAIIAYAVPYILVAAGLMYYNMVRFGSVTDFGYDYNLTVLDYTQKNLFLDRIVIGIYEYVFRIPRMGYRFPYLQQGSFAQGDAFGHGTFYYTWCYGGLLVCNWIVWCIPAALQRQEDTDGTKKRGLLQGRNVPALCLFVISVAELLINISVAGVAWHYLTDFSALFLLVGWIGATVLWKRLEGTAGLAYFRGFLIVAASWSFIYHSCFYLISNLQYGDTGAYYRLFHTFNFF
ncbi:MAG: hypothetical protein IKH46_09825 [Lachnospiraceae bacterium]|nr:hypothetical protein [Lachnospiraceae bacterium]